MITRRNFQFGAVATALGSSLAGPSIPSVATLLRPSRPLKLLVLGGTGYVGPALVRASILQGHQVTLFNRGISRPHLFLDLERLRGDRAPERDGGLAALKDREWDVVIDIPSYYPRQVYASAKALANSAKRYIIISSIAVYSDWSIVGMTENSPIRKPPEPSSYIEERNLRSDGPYYGGRKVACEQAVAKHFGQRWAAVRATGIIGAGIEDDDANKFYWPARVARGDTILAPGNGTQRLQSIDVNDLADFILHLAQTDTMGVFNAVGPARPFTTAEYVEAVERVTQQTANVVWSGKDLGDFPMYNDSDAFCSFDISHARKAGLTYKRTIEDSVRANWDWFKTNYSRDFDLFSAGFGLHPDVEKRGLAEAQA